MLEVPIEVEVDPNGLAEQIDSAREAIQHYPEWVRRESRFDGSDSDA